MQGEAMISHQEYCEHRRRVSNARSKINSNPPPAIQAKCSTNRMETKLENKIDSKQKVDLAKLMNKSFYVSSKPKQQPSGGEGKTPSCTSFLLKNKDYKTDCSTMIMHAFKEANQPTREVSKDDSHCSQCSHFSQDPFNFTASGESKRTTKSRYAAASVTYNPLKEREAVKVLKYNERNENPNHMIPKDILRYYERLTFFKTEDVLQKLLRPKISISFAAKSKGQLCQMGTATFQLYTEACPGLVLELVKCCNLMEGHNKMQILRIFDPVWVEGQLNVSSDIDWESVLTKNDLNAVSTRTGSGILTFWPHVIHSSVTDSSMMNFSITLSPLQVPPGQRFAIGMIVHGFDVLKQLKKYATKSGRPSDKIVVTKCQVV